MEKYLLMAIEGGNTRAMNNLGFYHKKVTKNYEEMEKYYMMAIEQGSSSAMKNYKYYLIKNLKKDEIINSLLKLRKELQETKSENDELKAENTHLKYRPGGPGMEEAQEEFENLCQMQNGLKE